MGARRVWAALAAGALLTIHAAAPARAVAPTVHAAGGRLVFIENRLLVSTWADGSHRLEAAVPGAFALGDATVSRDGKWVAFSMVPTSLVDPNLQQIWVSPVDLSHPRLVAAVAGRILSQPTWSPDGKRLAYVVGYPAGYFGLGYQAHLWVMDADGGHRRPVAVLPGAIAQPEWSPRGDQVAFVVDGLETSAFVDVVSVDKVAPIPKAVTPVGMIGLSKPHWSPSGNHLSFETSDGLYIVRADGTELQMLTQGDNYPYDGGAVWSPDGRWLAYCHANGGYFFGASGTGPNLVSADGKQHRTLGYVTCFWPSWSPDGRSLAYVAQAATHSALFIASVEGEDVREVSPAGWWLSWHDA